MESIKFLTLKEVLNIHRDQINRFGGMHGIKDKNLLDSAIHETLATFSGKFLYPDIFHMGAAYMYTITQNHPFLDGNKRTGTIYGLLFLAYNGHKLKKGVDLYAISMATARGETSITLLANFFKKNTFVIAD